MFNSIKKLFGQPDPRRVKEIIDPELGTLRWLEDESNWGANVSVGDQTIGFLIGGDSEPDEALLSHARDITRNLPAFLAMVSDFLSAELENNDWSAYTEEVENLQVEHVCLFWPGRPNDGMIYFHAEENYPVWRCDYANRMPKSLGFDS